MITIFVGHLDRSLVRKGSEDYEPNVGRWDWRRKGNWVSIGK